MDLICTFWPGCCSLSRLYGHLSSLYSQQFKREAKLNQSILGSCMNSSGLIVGEIKIKKKSQKPLNVLVWSEDGISRKSQKLIKCLNHSFGLLDFINYILFTQLYWGGKELSLYHFVLPCYQHCCLLLADAQ